MTTPALGSPPWKKEPAGHRKTEHGVKHDCAPVSAAPVVQTHDALIKLTYEMWVKKALPESQAWRPEPVDMGSEQWIG